MSGAKRRIMMKTFDDWFAFIILIAIVVIAFACSMGIANSDLPDWAKFVLLNR